MNKNNTKLIYWIFLAILVLIFGTLIYCVSKKLQEPFQGDFSEIEKMYLKQQQQFIGNKNDKNTKINNNESEKESSNENTSDKWSKYEHHREANKDDDIMDLRTMTSKLSQYVIKETIHPDNQEFMSNMIDKSFRKIIKPRARSEPIKYKYHKNFPKEEWKMEIDQILQDSKGWRSIGWNFERMDKSDIFKVVGLNSSMDDTGKESENDNDIVEGSLDGIDVVIHIATRDEMGKLFPEEHLKGLSVTDMGSRPMRIFFDLTNWTQVPVDFDGDLTVYHQYVVQHEMGHVLGYEHEETPKDKSGTPLPEKNCPVMYQQTKGTRGLCQANPWVSLES